MLETSGIDLNIVSRVFFVWLVFVNAIVWICGTLKLFVSFFFSGVTSDFLDGQCLKRQIF